MVFSFSGLINSLYSSCIKTLCGGHSWSLGPPHGDSDVGLYKMVSEFLTGRLGEHSLFPECWGKAAVGLGDGKVAPGDIAAPG